MSEDLRAALLAARTELWLLRHPARETIHPTAVGDVAHTMLRLGVLGLDSTGRLISRAGGSPDDVLLQVKAASPFLFKDADDGHPTTAPCPDPKSLKPGDRLALANGEDMRRLL